MKILYIQKEGGIFGAEQFHLKTIPELLKKGIEIEFIRLYTDYQLGIDSPFARKLNELGVKVYQVKITRVPLPNQLLKIKRIIKRGNYDLVHTHLIHADLYGALVKQFLLPKIILTSTKHGYDESYINEFGFDHKHRRKNAYWRINKYTERVGNKSYAISDGLRNFFVNAGISDPNKIVRIHYGFEMKQFIQDRENEKYRLADKQLVIAGRLVNFKGHRYALQALKLVKETFPKILLLVIGVGYLENELKSIVKEYNMESNVRFIGFSDHVEDYMSNSDVVLIPSIAEGFGVVFLEAINQRKPIAAFDVPAGNEILPESYQKYLSKFFDISEYANNIKLMLTNPQQMIKPIEDAEKKMLSYFKLDRMTNEMIEFYKQIIKENK